MHIAIAGLRDIPQKKKLWTYGIVERTVNGMTLNEAIKKNGIGMLKEYFEEWLKEKQLSEAMDKPISLYELAEFFEYVENAIWNGL